MKCLILGAGYAVRLYPLTRERPKPLLPIGGTPILQRIVEKVYATGAVDHVYVVTNHRFAGHYWNWKRDFENQKKKLAAPIDIFDDLTTSNDDRLGAIGDMDFVIKNAKVNDDLLVISGDNLFDFDLKDFLTFAKKKRAAVCLHDVKTKERAALYGIVSVAKDRCITEFEEKPPAPASTLACIGVYYFGKEHVPLVRQYLEEGGKKDAPGYYIEWLHHQVKLYGWVIPGSWYDIGDIDSYNNANELYVGKR
jgi:glucose-1-phosphate thymidylyltransferase